MPLTDNYIFELDEDVTRTRVSYKNRFGITIAADLYLPKSKAHSGAEALDRPPRAQQAAKHSASS